MKPQSRAKQIAGTVVALIALLAGFGGCILWLVDLSRDGETAAIVGFCIACAMALTATAIYAAGQLLWKDLRRIWR